jgi:hypothetical protein
MAQRQIIPKCRPEKLTMAFRLCASCAGAGSSYCGRCKQVRYCGRTCQSGHWQRHKQVCGSDPAGLLGAAKLNEAVRNVLVNYRDHKVLPKSELGTLAALAETRPWAPHVVAMTLLLIQWHTLVTRAGTGAEEPRDAGLLATYLVYGRLIVGGATPDLDHPLMALLWDVVATVDDRVGDQIGLELMTHWMSGKMADVATELLEKTDLLDAPGKNAVSRALASAQEKRAD